MWHVRAGSTHISLTMRKKNIAHARQHIAREHDLVEDLLHIQHLKQAQSIRTVRRRRLRPRQRLLLMHLMRGMQVAVAHGPQDTPRREHVHALHARLERLTHCDEPFEVALLRRAVLDPLSALGDGVVALGLALALTIGLGFAEPHCGILEIADGGEAETSDDVVGVDEGGNEAG